MVRKFKILGPALAVALVMSAVVASVSLATPATLTTFPAGKSVIATGEQIGEQEFALTDHPVGEGGGFGVLKCKKLTLTGTEAGSSGSTMTRVHPSLSECTAFGLPITVTTVGCDFVVKNGTQTATGGWHTSTDIVCSGGSVIKMVGPACEVTIGAQTGLTTSEITNAGSASPETAMNLLLHTYITGIKYTVVKDAIGCPLKGTGSFGKGDYVGTSILRWNELNTGVPVGVTYH